MACSITQGRQGGVHRTLRTERINTDIYENCGSDDIRTKWPLSRATKVSTVVIQRADLQSPHEITLLPGSVINSPKNEKTLPGKNSGNLA